MNLFKRLYKYREFLKTNIKKDIRGKYKKSFLGVFWSFLNPLLSLVVYATIFPMILKSSEANYTMFLMTALIPWTFFTSSITLGSFCMIANGDLLKKVYFPREIIPISTVTSCLINFLISTIIVIVFLFISGIGLSWYILYYPLIVLIQYIFLLGAGFILSSVTVFVRDLEHIITVIIMALFYGTPIVYSLSSIPSQFAFFIGLNPMSTIVMSYRDILYYQQTPNLMNLMYVGIFSVVILILGYFIFNKLQRKFAEEF